MKKERKLYERTPVQFMQGKIFIPHYFSDPQNPEHGQYVNLQIRNNMWNLALHRITFCQFNTFSLSEQEIKIQKIQSCKGPDPIFGFANNSTNVRTDAHQMIGCEDWTVALKTKNNKQRVRRSVYRVKIFQTTGDLFYPEVHPPTMLKYLKLLYYFWQ